MAGERVRIRVHGRQRDDVGALHESRMTADARHDAKGGTHFFRYEDRALLEGQTVPTLLKLASGSLLLVRRASFAQRLEFFPQEERASLYRTPYGVLHIAVRTKELFSACRADGTGRIELVYDLFVEGRFQSNNDVRIDITNARRII